MNTPPFVPVSDRFDCLATDAPILYPSVLKNFLTPPSFFLLTWCSATAAASHAGVLSSFTHCSSKYVLAWGPHSVIFPKKSVPADLLPFWLASATAVSPLALCNWSSFAMTCPEPPWGWAVVMVLATVGVVMVLATVGEMRSLHSISVRSQAPSETPSWCFGTAASSEGTNHRAPDTSLRSSPPSKALRLTSACSLNHFCLARRGLRLFLILIATA